MSSPLDKVLLVRHASFLPRLHLVFAVPLFSVLYLKTQGYYIIWIFFITIFMYCLCMILLLTNFGWLNWFNVLYVFDVCKGLLYEMLRSAKLKDSKSTWKVCWSCWDFFVIYWLALVCSYCLLVTRNAILISLVFQSLLSRCLSWTKLRLR